MGEPADWSEGDWNGDGVFDQLDIVAALRTGNYRAASSAARVQADNHDAVHDILFSGLDG